MHKQYQFLDTHSSYQSLEEFKEAMTIVFYNFVLCYITSTASNVQSCGQIVFICIDSTVVLLI